MIIDTNLLLSGAIGTNGTLSSQSLGAIAFGTPVASTYSVDKAPLAGNQIADWGAGEALSLVVSITTAIPTSTVSTFQVQLVEADDSGLTSNVQVVSESPAYALTEMTVGKQIVVACPRSTPRNSKRYLGARYVAGTNGINTGGTVLASLVKDVPDWGPRSFANGFSVA